MNCLLIYYTGTFNTRYLTDMLKERLAREGVSVTAYEIDPLKTEKLDFAGYDLLGLGYPIYGFNAPWPFLKFIRAQTFPAGLKTFIYKNSGETYHANDASSVNVVRKLRRDHADIRNEYHFIMPYNIHFRFEETLVREMLDIDGLLLDILTEEVLKDIPNIKKYRLIHRIITFFVKLQFIGGDVNSLFCRVKKDRCSGCGLCIRNCPMHNIKKNKKGQVRFGHKCLMCMRCSMNCPRDAVHAGLLDDVGWHVNGPYDFEKIRKLPVNEVITERTEGFFRCYKETYGTVRKRHRQLFGDKLSSEGTSVNEGGASGGSIEDILVDLEENGGHVGRNYSLFIRSKMRYGLKPSANYVRSGYDLAQGKSLLFNTPFYYKLSPYVFYAINRALILDKKVLIVLGRHGTTQDVFNWCEDGFRSVSNMPELWKIKELTSKKFEDDDMPDVGIITRSAVHDLDIHSANLNFLSKVAFVVIIEPSKLIPTAQIGLNLLIKSCGSRKKITYCSVDRNCDGLVDSLSHVLMANITEVAATEFPNGMSSFMCWTADDEYIQHRLIPGVSRYLGMGTELSFVALKNQVEKTTWYGGDVYPVVDEHWIAKQYYYELLEYASLPTIQETFDKYYIASNNMCDERVNDNSYVTVEDERNNVFEVKRCFATIAEKQGFVNVISMEYMLREYMTDNTLLFNTDAKAIPYITADFARTKRNMILTICLNLCISGMIEEELCSDLKMMDIDTSDIAGSLWNEICKLFCPENNGTGEAIVIKKAGTDEEYRFEKNSTITDSREYMMKTGRFETVYSISDQRFAGVILEDLQNAKYISERREDDSYLGGELKGHIYQKYLPGQFFTLNGKYYEMISATSDNCIQVRRASEYINGRVSYRQVRTYEIKSVSNSEQMGELKTVNDIDIYYQYADFSVATPAYWKLSANNDFRNGSLVEINGIPERNYCHKQILKLDFSKIGDTFTDSVRLTLTALINEVFSTLFADNQAYIAAVTPGEVRIPLTYSINAAEGTGLSDKSIYIIEDSQLDLGLLIAVERNINRILQIISDYLSWNEEKIEESIARMNAAAQQASNPMTLEEAAEIVGTKTKKPCIFARFGAWLKRLFKKKDKSKPDAEKKKKEKKPKVKKERKKKKGKDAPETAENPAQNVLNGDYGTQAGAETEQEEQTAVQTDLPANDDVYDGSAAAAEENEGPVYETAMPEEALTEGENPGVSGQDIPEVPSGEITAEEVDEDE